MKRAATLVFLCVALTSSARAGDASGPQNVHVIPSLNPSEAMTVVFWDLEKAERFVEYRPAKEKEWKRTSAGEPITYKDEDADVYYYYAKLEDLSPGTGYVYRCGSEKSGWCRERSFRAAPKAGGGTIRMVFNGDYRKGLSTGATNKLAALMAREDPDIALLLGDMVTGGHKKWKRCMDALAPILDVAAAIPAEGNWEKAHGWGNAYPFYHAHFPPPEGKDYFYLDWGPIRLVSLNDYAHLEHPKTEEEKQAEVIKEQLDLIGEAFKDVPDRWRIAMSHEPKGRQRSGHSTWSEAFFAARTHLVINASWHIYHRSRRKVPGDMNRFKPSGPDEFGTVYVVSGGGGQTLSGLDPEAAKEPCAAATVRKHHYVLLEIAPEKIKLSAKDTEGNVFDQAELLPNGKAAPDEEKKDEEEE